MGFGSDAQVYIDILGNITHVGTLVYDLDGVALDWKLSTREQLPMMESYAAAGIVARAMHQIMEHDPADDAPAESESTSYRHAFERLRAAADDLLRCIAEFGDDPTACAECFDALDDVVDEVRLTPDAVGPPDDLEAWADRLARDVVDADD